MLALTQIRIGIGVVVLAALFGWAAYTDHLRQRMTALQTKVVTEMARADENAAAYAALSVSALKQNTEINKQHAAFVETQARLKVARAEAEKVRAATGAQIVSIDAQVADHQSSGSDQCGAVFKLIGVKNPTWPT